MSSLLSVKRFKPRYLVKFNSTTPLTGVAATSYQFIFKTGTAQFAEGGRSGYFYKFVGNGGETGEYDCVGKRDKGETGSCSLTDDKDIGELKGLKIRNSGTDSWQFVSMKVKIDGILWGTWEGSQTVSDLSTKSIEFTRTSSGKVFQNLTTP